jgi:hypothetical protein
MAQARMPGRPRPTVTTVAACVREFLTPAVWKPAQRVRSRRRSSQRWTAQAVIVIAALMTWCDGDSQAERFAVARAFYVAGPDKRRRPGRTAQGYQKALARLPLAVLRCVATGVRRRLMALMDLTGAGFVVLGCDGTRIECPRTAELEARLGRAGKAHSAPTIWVTALVHLRSGLLWAWRIGKGTASERDHLRQLLTTLAPLAAPVLLVADAGYNGYDLATAMIDRGVSFLIRTSSKVSLYTASGGGQRVRARVRDRVVYYWPRRAQPQGRPPVRVRLLRVRGKTKGPDVWLLTDVLDRRRLPKAVAARSYRWRWENEGLFRTYKRTLSKVKLASRTVRLVHREAESSLLATQLLLALGARRTKGDRSRPRQVLLAIRADLRRPAGGRTGPNDGRRLTSARRERRERPSAKVKRRWPRRVDHTPPKPPNLLTLTSRQKALFCRLKREAA